MANGLTHPCKLLRESLCAVFLLLLVLCATSQAEGPATVTFKSQSTVGLPVTITQLVLPGSELEPIPWDDSTLVVLKMETVYPAFAWLWNFQAALSENRVAKERL